VKVSVIATVYNEAASLPQLLDSLAHQTRPPDEVVVSDAGSTDGTLDLLAASSLHMLRVVDAPGNRSVGRNAAIVAAAGDVIACIDGGCVAETTWLERLVRPFQEGSPSWVSGFYRPGGRTDLSTSIGLVIVYVDAEVRRSPDGFLPSARSMAFTKEAWRSVGGFPEHVDFAEDTLFGEKLRAAGHRPVVVLDAVVLWVPPSNFGSLARTTYRWGAGDAKAGIRGPTYKRLLVGYGGAAALTAVSGVFLPRLIWLGPLAVLGDTLWRTRDKYGSAPQPSGYWLVPIAHIVATYSMLAGFLIGYLRRRLARGRAATGDDEVPDPTSP
jgi:cellulose synthase/poly-beta-1,6-N-acetylglucosamine synthase-like glycosyltransferase